MSRVVVVVGGGIAGLSAALGIRDLAERSGVKLDLSVLEASERLGGNIRTTHEAGFAIEHGPSGFLDNGPETLALAERLGLEPLRANAEAGRRFLLFGGQLVPLPKGPLQLIRTPLLSARAKLRLLGEPFVQPGGKGDESVASFAARRLGPEVVETLVDAFVAGVFAGDPRELSIRSGFPTLHRLEQEHGSIFRGLRSLRRTGRRSMLCSFERGLETWFPAFARELDGSVRTAARVLGIDRVESGFRLRVQGQPDLDADAVVLTAPASAASSLTRSLDARLSDDLKQLSSSASLAVLALGYPRANVSHPLDGFGFLAPRRESRAVLGCLWDSSIFRRRAPDGHVLFRVMLGGERGPEVMDLDDAGLQDVALSLLRPLLGLTGDPSLLRVFRHAHAIPQYRVGHVNTLARVDAALERMPGLFLSGSAYRGVGMNDCIADAATIAQAVVCRLAGAH